MRCCERNGERAVSREASVLKGLAHGMPASLFLWYLIYLAALHLVWR